MGLIQERRSNERLIGQLYIRLQNLFAENDTLKKQLEVYKEKCDGLGEEIKELKRLVAVQQATIEALDKKRGK